MAEKQGPRLHTERMGPELWKQAARGDRTAGGEVERALRRHMPEQFAFVRQAPPTRTAHVLLQLPVREARELLRRLPDAPNLAILSVLDPDIREQLLDASVVDHVAAAIADLGVTSAADVVSGLPPTLVRQLLARHPQSTAIWARVSHSEGSVGGEMRQSGVASALPDTSLAQIVADVRRRPEQAEQAGSVYIVDEHQRLVGYLKLTDLLVQPHQSTAREVMRTDVMAITDTVDREEAVRLADENHLLAVPVVDGQRRLLGLVTPQQLRGIVRDEMTDDIKALGTLPPDADAFERPWEILRNRFPWLALALIGSGLAGLIVGSFEDALEEAVLLAAFIPLVMDMAGNAGIQASTVTIAAMTGDSFWKGDQRERILREFVGSILNGLAIGALTALLVLGVGASFTLDAPLALAVAIGVALLAVVVQAAIVGAVVPLALERMVLDPAAGTGVFITTVNDLLGITILFVSSILIYLPHLH